MARAPSTLPPLLQIGSRREDLCLVDVGFQVHRDRVVWVIHRVIAAVIAVRISADRVRLYPEPAMAGRRDMHVIVHFWEVVREVSSLGQAIGSRYRVFVDYAVRLRWVARHRGPACNPVLGVQWAVW